MIRVFLAGEGKNDLGVLETLLRRVHPPSGWEVVDAIEWRRIPKYKAGEHASAEARNVAGAALRARETKCEVLAFVRDRDGDKQRHSDVEAGIALAEQKVPAVRVVGGVAVEKLEAWILAACGESRSEEHRSPEDELAKVGVKAKQSAAYVARIEQCDLSALPNDAAHFLEFCRRVRELWPADESA